MYRVNLNGPLKFNRTGYGEVLEFTAGEHEVPDELATFLWANPELGEVLAAEDDAPSDESPLPEDDAEFLEGRVPEVVARIVRVTDIERLGRLRGLEEDGARPRKGVLEAVDERLAAIEESGS